VKKMSEPNDKELGTQSEEKKEATPQELAESWLNFRIGQVRRKVIDKKRSIEFNRSYKPSLPSTPGEGPGSMDYSDYEVSQLETEQWDYERDDLIDELEGDLYRLDDELEGIHAQTKKVTEGDTELINYLAAKEKERRAEIEEKRRRKEMSKA